MLLNLEMIKILINNSLKSLINKINKWKESPWKKVNLV